MKIFLAAILLSLSVFSFAEIKIEPSASPFEIRVMEKVSGEDDAKKRLGILLEAASDKNAGVVIFFNAANACAVNSDPENAEFFYGKALAAMPSFYEARRNLAFLYYNNGRHAEALQSFAKAVSLSEIDSARIYRAYASSLMELKFFDEALTSLEKALMYAPDDASLLRSKAYCLRETGQAARLRKFCGELIRRNPKDAVYWRLLCKLDIEADDLHSAAANIQAMRKLNLADSSDMVLLGDIYSSLELYKHAANAYANQNMDPDKAYRIAKFFAVSGAHDEARVVAKNLDEESAGYWEVEAIALISQNRDPKVAFEKSYAKNPANDFVALKLGDIALKEKRTEAAKTFYTQAIRNNPVAARWGLACAHIEAGDYSLAADTLEKLPDEVKRKDLNAYISALRKNADDEK